MAKLQTSFVPEAPGSGGRNPNIILQWPSKENAIVAKFVCDPLYDNGKKMYRPVQYFPHPTGTKDSDRSRHVCQTFLGSKDSPENDFFWEKVKELSALKKANRGDSDEARFLKELIRSFKPSKKGWFLIVRPDSKVIQAIRVPESGIDILMGKKADAYNKEEIPSLLNKMQAEGNSPFDLTNTKGWVKLYKTGDKLTTKYFIEEAQIDATAETKDGKKITYQTSLEANVDQHLLSDDVDSGEIPNVVEFEKKYAFSYEESVNYVKSMGTLAGVPKRFLRNSQQATEAVEAPESHGATTYQQVSEDDIPF